MTTQPAAFAAECQHEHDTEREGVGAEQPLNANCTCQWEREQGGAKKNGQDTAEREEPFAGDDATQPDGLRATRNSSRWP
jgi:hypothetical protein